MAAQYENTFLHILNFTMNASSFTGSQGNATSLLFSPFLVKILKLSVMFLVIVGALLGNALVILSVLWFVHLRSVITNYFIVSMAFADFLVALLVMPFNASQTFTDGGWVFGQLMCDIFNANDVLFCTASITHLCCISVDRYIAIIHPLRYANTITHRRVGTMLAMCWIISATISYVPVHTGLYTTPEHIQTRVPGTCPWAVNMYFALISSTISFWIPLLIMCIIYLRIFLEAGKQERKMYRLMKMTESSQSHADDRLDRNSQPNSHNDSVVSTRERKRIRREHKAAKTLSIIMGCFAMCWLPFFIWYAVATTCGKACPYPDILVTVLFWIGYCNSTLNPVIYGLRNREFKQAFAHLLGLRRCLGRKDHRKWRAGDSDYQDNQQRLVATSPPPMLTQKWRSGDYNKSSPEKMYKS